MPEWILKEIAAAFKAEPHGDATRLVTGVNFDSRKLTQGQMFVAVKTTTNDGHDYVVNAAEKGMSGAIVSDEAFNANRDIWTELPLISVPDPVIALGAWASWHRQQNDIPVVAITGSNGKTTVKELIAAVLGQKFETLKTAANFNNHLGVPMTLLEIGAKHDMAVVEIGMNHPGEIGQLAKIARPTIGVITNAGQAHMEAFPSKDTLIDAKWELSEELTGERLLIINKDDDGLRQRQERHNGPLLSYSVDSSDSDYQAVSLSKNDSDRWSFSVCGQRFVMAIPGRHTVSNALAAIAVADRLGVSFGESAQALASAQGPAMRMRTETLGGVTIINDAYNANPGSMRAALNSLSAVAADEPDRRSIAVLGGMLELGAEGDALHRETGALAASLGVTLVTVGPLGTLIAQGALDSGSDADQIFVYSTHDEAAKWLASETSSGDAVLIKGSRGARMETVLERWRQLTASSVAA